LTGYKVGKKFVV